MLYTTYFRSVSPSGFSTAASTLANTPRSYRRRCVPVIAMGESGSPGFGRGLGTPLEGNQRKAVFEIIRQDGVAVHRHVEFAEWLPCGGTELGENTRF